MDSRCVECLEVNGDCLRVAPQKPDDFPHINFFDHNNKDCQGLAACLWSNHGAWQSMINRNKNKNG